MSSSKKKEKSLPDAMEFEDALEELEKITRALESGQLSLNESIKAYERGMELRKQAAAVLEAAERKLEYLEKKTDGSVEKKEVPLQDHDLFGSSPDQEKKAKPKGKAPAINEDDEDEIPF